MTTTQATVAPTNMIEESKTNPRRAFDKAAMADLVESVRNHGVLQPVLVRPHPHSLDVGKIYELVAGHRRLRAAIKAELEEIPVVCRELTDKEVLEIQVIENLQREGLHPLEEAGGYDRLHREFKYSADELAAKVGKSKAYIYGRMKLCSLPSKSKKLFLDGKIDAARALLVARIPDKKLADEAAANIQIGTRYPATLAECREYVEQHYMLRLKGAPFAPHDGSLLPKVGPCDTCVKRTGNQRELFGDVKENDICTDTVCFRKKADATWEKEKAKAEAEGRRVLEGKKAEETRYGAQWIDISDQCWRDDKNRKYSTLLREAGFDLKGDQAVLCRRSSSERPRTLVPTSVAMKALRDAKLIEGESATAKSPAATKRDRAHRIRLKAVEEALPDMVDGAAKIDSSKELLRFIADAFLRGHAEPIRKVAKRRGWSDPNARQWKSELDALSEGDLRGLIVELVALDYACPPHGSSYGDGWKAACKLVGMLMSTYEKRVAAASKKKRKKKASRSTKKKTGTRSTKRRPARKAKRVRSTKKKVR